MKRILPSLLIFTIIGCGTVVKEVGPSALLRKYEWFKNASAGLDKLVADVKLYEVRLKQIEEDNKNLAKSKWPRDERENYNQVMAEMTGLKARYNALAAEYNAAMAKDNWNFCDVGNVPRGGTALPREYKLYMVQ